MARTEPTPIPFALQAYQDRSLPVAAQECINLYAQVAPENEIDTVALHGTPGQVAFVEVGSGPIRGMLFGNSLIYAVSADELYSIDSAGVTTLLGSGMPIGDDNVSMAFNGTEVAIGVNDAGWLWNGTTLAAITDPDFIGGSTVAFQDGYFIWTLDGTALFSISALYDGSTYDALDFATAESLPDDLTRVIVDHREAWLFGEKSIEVWFNSGAQDFPFARIDGAVLERGTNAPHSVVKMDNSLYWLGDDLVVYRAVQYTPERISTHGIEKLVGEMSTLVGVAGYTFTEEGHKFYALDLPGKGSFFYDITTNLWHQRQAYTKTLWQGCCGVEAFNRVYVGDRTSGDIWRLDLDTYQDNGTTIQRLAAAPALDFAGRRFITSRLEIRFEGGVGLTLGQGVLPQSMLTWSDDGGHTWSSERWRNIGPLGNYSKRAVWNSMGESRHRNYRVTISDPIKVAIRGATANLMMGSA